MYFVSSYRTAQALKAGDISLFTTVTHGIFFIGSLLWRLNVPTLLPILYYSTFSWIKLYLEEQVAPAPLIINVFPLADWVLFINYFLLFVGTIYALMLHKKRLTESIKDTITLLWPITVRILFFSLLLCIILGIIFGGYFGYKLLLISKEPGPQGPTFFPPLKYLLKAAGKISIIKNWWAKLFQLPKAQLIFEQINIISLYAWYICHAVSLMSTMLAIVQLRKWLNYVKGSSKNT